MFFWMEQFAARLPLLSSDHLLCLGQNLRIISVTAVFWIEQSGVTEGDILLPEYLHQSSKLHIPEASNVGTHP
jgi:hypothetical protein